MRKEHRKVKKRHFLPADDSIFTLALDINVLDYRSWVIGTALHLGLESFSLVYEHCSSSKKQKVKVESL